ncbi:potassium channel family protein [Novosphingobium sp. RD2P27]|uniref:Potassium channel family protein n=1 Tax=Novosphingobium kalidii TaxID=3230299 RepID=A0ABV2D552_9SPHN
MNALLTLAGAALILIAIADVFLTVLYARISVGFLTPRLYRATWLTLKAVAPAKEGGRNALLSYAGPLMIVETVIVWSLLIQFGFALIYWPALGSGISAASGSTSTDFSTALYFSGYSFTTLGTGDITPQTPAYRMLMIAEAWIGFSVLTLTLTYLMSVYSALVRRNTLAQILHHMTDGSGQPVRLVAGLVEGGCEGAKSQLMPIGSQILDLLESHHSYPILHYFRMRDARYATTRIAYITLESATLIHTALAPEYGSLQRSAAVSLLWGSAQDLLQQTSTCFLHGSPDEKLKRDDRETFRSALEVLSRSNIATSDDQFEAYCAARDEWFPTINAFVDLMGYRVEDIVPPTTSSSEQSHPRPGG